MSTKNRATQEPVSLDRFERRYSLEELAERWGTSISYVEECVRRYEFGRLILSIPDRKGGLPTIEYHYFDETQWPFGNCDYRNKLGAGRLCEFAYLIKKKDDGYYYSPTIKISIPEGEVLWFEEAKNLSLEEPSTPGPGKPWTWIKSKVLRIAVHAYYELYLKNGIKTKGAPKPQILAWLSKNYPNLNSNQRKTIAYMVNCKPEGGAPRQ